MIRINLIPAAEVERAEGRRHDIATGAMVLAGAVAFFVGMHTWQYFQVSAANREIARLQQELEKVLGPYKDVMQMDKEKKELAERLQVIGELEARRTGPVKALEDLSGASPDKLWLTEFAETGGALKLVGLGVDEQTVADFLRKLATSPYFRNVDLEETSQVDQDGVKHKKFAIKASMNYLGTAEAKPDAKAATDKPAPGKDAPAAPKKEIEE